MQPIVLIGGDEVHYRLIRSLSKQQLAKNNVLLVSQSQKFVPLQAIPAVIAGLVSESEAQLDLWKACQRKGVHFLQDECLNVQREDKRVHLRNFGKIQYKSLSITTNTLPGKINGEDVSQFVYESPSPFIKQLNSFFEEVHKHCPREVRVVLTGLSRESIELAWAIRSRLVGACEVADLIIVEERPIFKKGLLFSTRKLEKQLKRWGIRVVDQAYPTGCQSHLLSLSDGSSVSFDILIPMSSWRAKDSLSKIFQGDKANVEVERSLSFREDENVYVSGLNVHFKGEANSLFSIENKELSSVLLHNVFSEEGDPKIACRDHFKVNRIAGLPEAGFSLWKSEEDDLNGQKKQWGESVHKGLQRLKQVDLEEEASSQLSAQLLYQGEHMSRPWQGWHGNGDGEQRGAFCLTSFNGFNSWGSFAQSAMKICEIALLKAMTHGIRPERLRFNLTLPTQDNSMTHHIFESTFKAVELMCDQHQVEIDGGDTFDGDYWHLMVTIGGVVEQHWPQKFENHDYLLLTKPLGFGALWAGRLKDSFDSAWVNESLQEPSLVSYENYKKFISEFQPSAQVLVEEWGFLYHCLQKTPVHQQLMINFREVPRWPGVDLLSKESLIHPGLSANWQRIEKDVAFKQTDVSKANSILWDSMSQGALVFGISSDRWVQALTFLRQMGYKRAALVGCIRPKVNGNRVVLSDWSPA